MKIFSERAKAARSHSGLNQSQAALKIGISRESVSQWENGKTKSINAQHLHVAADAYGVSSRWLGSGEGQMLPADPKLPEGFDWNSLSKLKKSLIIDMIGLSENDLAEFTVIAEAARSSDKNIKSPS